MCEYVCIVSGGCSTVTHISLTLPLALWEILPLLLVKMNSWRSENDIKIMFLELGYTSTYLLTQKIVGVAPHLIFN